MKADYISKDGAAHVYVNADFQKEPVLYKFDVMKALIDKFGEEVGLKVLDSLLRELGKEVEDETVY